MSLVEVIPVVPCWIGAGDVPVAPSYLIPLPKSQTRHPDCQIILQSHLTRLLCPLTSVPLVPPFSFSSSCQRRMTPAPIVLFHPWLFVLLAQTFVVDELDALYTI